MGPYGGAASSAQRPHSAIGGGAASGTAPSSAAVVVERKADNDALLQEYLRIINAKDAEIYNLLSQVQRLDLEMRKKEDKYRSKLKELKSAVEAFQNAADGADRRHQQEAHDVAKLRIERDQMVTDAATLKAAMLRQEEHMQAAMKTASKAAKHEAASREKLDAEAHRQRRVFDEREQSLQDRIAILETQSNTIQRRASDAEAELQRARADAVKQAEARGELEEAVRDLRRRLRDVTAKEAAHVDHAHVDARNVATISSLEQELNRVRTEALEEASKAARRDVLAQELKGQVQRLESELSIATRQAQDAEAARAQDKLVRVQQLEEWRGDAEKEFARMEEQANKLLKERGTLQTELATAQRRLQELDSRNATMESSHRQREESLETENHNIKLRLVEMQHEVEGAKRQVAQSEAVARHLKDRIEGQREEALTECSRIKEELEAARLNNNRNQAALGQLESQLIDARRELSTAQTEAANANRRDGELRRRVAELEDTQRIARDQEASRRLEADVVAKDMQAQHSMALREVQRDLTVARAEVVAMREQVASLTDRSRALESELNSTQSHAAAKAERERALTQSQREMDERIVKLEMQVAERDAAISALRRNTENQAASLNSAQAANEDMNRRHQVLNGAHENLRMELQQLRMVIQQREDEKSDLVRQLQKAEGQASVQSQELANQTHAMKDRVQTLLSEIHAAEQRLIAERAERGKAEAKHHDDLLNTNRTVVGPLQEKVDALVTLNQRLQRDNQEREARIAELNMQLSDAQALGRRLELMTDEAKRNADEVNRLRVVERELINEKEYSRRAKADAEAATSRATISEGKVDLVSRELTDLRNREAQATAQLGSKRAEVSSLQEINANLESLRSIGERQLHDAQQRERALAEKLDEARSAYNVLQSCVQQQQEQLEALRRLRATNVGGGGGGGIPTSPAVSQLVSVAAEQSATASNASGNPPPAARRFLGSPPRSRD